MYQSHIPFRCNVTCAFFFSASFLCYGSILCPLYVIVFYFYCPLIWISLAVTEPFFGFSAEREFRSVRTRVLGEVHRVPRRHVARQRRAEAEGRGNHFQTLAVAYWLQGKSGPDFKFQLPWIFPSSLLTPFVFLPTCLIWFCSNYRILNFPC